MSPRMEFGGITPQSFIKARQKLPFGSLRLIQHVNGGVRNYGSADFYANQLKNNRNYTPKTKTYENGYSWTGYTDENGCHKGFIGKWGDNTHIQVGKETFVDENSDGTIDRSFILEGDTIVHFRVDG